MKLENLNDLFFAAHCDAVHFDWRTATAGEVKYMRGTWERLMRATGFDLRPGSAEKFSHEEGKRRLKYILDGIEPMVRKVMAKIDAKRAAKHN
jgi:hypothetical protein